ncbi:MAG: SpoVA/SpoVAEb family sporulation membrane protein [Clostridiales bacterium]|nr:SpoVA/SpoVAEb family sporulation membrane protein [Clostridiales bacterium]
MNEVWQNIATYAIVFAVGGALCAIAELLIVRTKLTPARILVIFLIVGIILEGVGVYDYIYKVCQAGISVPIVGFGAALAKGSIEMARTVGFVGAFAGGLMRTGYGVGVAIVMSYLVTLVFNPKTK